MVIFRVITITQAGHLIGNHTYSHIQLKSGNKEAFKEELIKTKLSQASPGRKSFMCAPLTGAGINLLKRN